MVAVFEFVRSVLSTATALEALFTYGVSYHFDTEILPRRFHVTRRNKAQHETELLRYYLHLDTQQIRITTKRFTIVP